MSSDNNFIHPTSIIEEGCKIGKNNYIGPFCYIKSNTIIGNNNRIEGYCSIATPAEHKNYFNSQSGFVVIGNNNVIREFVTINAGTIRKTVIGDNNIFLRTSHIGHDSIIEDRVTLSCDSLIGGHSYIMEGCNFGLGAICHQYSIIGAYSMLGMGSVVTKKSNILCGEIHIGIPAKFLKKNEIGLSRNNISEDKLIILQQRQNNLIKEYS